MSERRDTPELPRTVEWPGSMVLIVTAARNLAGQLEVRVSKHVDGGVHRQTVWLSTPEETAEYVRSSIGEMIGLDPDSAPDPTPGSAPLRSSEPGAPDGTDPSASTGGIVDPTGRRRIS